MSTTASTAPRRRRTNDPVDWLQPARPRPRRAPSRILAGAALVAVGGWIAAVAYLSVGSRREVLVLAHPVPRYHLLSRGDLRVTRVAAEPTVATVDAAHLDGVLGRRTARPLGRGALLADDALLAANARPVTADEAVVGALLAPGDAPNGLQQGDRVQVVIRPLAGTTAMPITFSGWVLDVGERAPGAETRPVSVVVPHAQAGLASAAAADARVALVVMGEP